MPSKLPASLLNPLPPPAWSLVGSFMAPGAAASDSRMSALPYSDPSATGSGSASTAPMHLVALADCADLGRHQSHCTPVHRRWARVQCGALHLRGFVLARRVTSLALVLALVLSVAMWR